MTTAVGRSVRLEIAATFASNKTVTAISLANPGVATSTSHGMINGTVGFWTGTGGGMPQLEGQATRVYNQSTNAFDLQGLDTTDYSAWVTGGTFTPVATWITISEAIGLTLGGGAQERLDDTKLHDVVQQDVFGVLPADTAQVDLLRQTVDGTAMAAIASASIRSTNLVWRATLHDGSVCVWRGSPSRPGLSLQRKQLATGGFQIAVKGLALACLPA